MSDLTREQVEAYVGGTEKNDCRIPCPECAAEPICDGVFGKYELAVQLLATMDALTKTNRVLVAQRVYAEECEREITTVEARIEAALAVLERKVKSWDDVKEAIAILRGDHDTKGERL
jgi:hypothetical protein